MTIRTDTPTRPLRASERPQPPLTVRALTRRIVVTAPVAIVKLVMRAAATIADLSAGSIPRPTDAPSGHAPGPDADRLLILGAGPAVGWGVRSHGLALPGALARAIAARTGRGCRVDVVADPGMSGLRALHIVSTLALHAYDAVLIVPGVNDALRLTRVAPWKRTLGQILVTLARRAPFHTQFFVTTVQPASSIAHYDRALLGRLADRHATALNTAAALVCRGVPRTRLIPLPAAAAEHSNDGRHRTPQQYALWADVLAAHVAGTLRSRPAPLTEPSPEGESARLRAIDELGPRELAGDPILTRLVTRARDGFESATAILTMIGREQQWNLAASEPMPLAVPREFSFCTYTIRGGGPLVVPDTTLDVRFRRNPVVTDGPKVRFYAGFPVEAPTGERIGALCVLDTRPRSEHSVDTVYLRELALQAERRLWSLAGARIA